MDPNTHTSKVPGRPHRLGVSKGRCAPRHLQGSGVTAGRCGTRPVVVGWVDVRHCVPVRDVSRRTETRASPQSGVVLFNSHTITALITVT